MIFEAVLCEARNIVDVFCIDCAGDDSWYNGAVQGFENPDGAVGAWLQGRNAGGDWSVPPDDVRFEPAAYPSDTLAAAHTRWVST